ncbi:hypothetical protein JMN32_03190 [Fulvivirga sp. 29W222]|uniref:Uncharacterized protein n=1 Tax=Fulvivirga marina TaxID=2494733 RepID=A0A937FUQ8_9BACT|nr:hypothetical protein [Fulvivirga marina]MBL6445297.1 hypothetical protein [Fulvivirga marina]
MSPEVALNNHFYYISNIASNPRGHATGNANQFPYWIAPEDCFYLIANRII